MDRSVIDQKFESLRKCLQRIKQKIPKTAEELEKNIDTQDIVSVNLERAIQLSVDIASHILSCNESPVPETMADSFKYLSNAGIISEAVATKLQKAVGFRNIMIHEYKSKVFSIATTDLDDFKSFMRAVDAWLAKQK